MYIRQTQRTVVSPPLHSIVSRGPRFRITPRDLCTPWPGVGHLYQTHLLAILGHLASRRHPLGGKSGKTVVIPPQWIEMQSFSTKTIVHPSVVNNFPPRPPPLASCTRPSRLYPHEPTAHPSLAKVCCPLAPPPRSMSMVSNSLFPRPGKMCRPSLTCVTAPRKRVREEGVVGEGPVVSVGAQDGHQNCRGKLSSPVGLRMVWSAGWLMVNVARARSETHTHLILTKLVRSSCFSTFLFLRLRLSSICLPHATPPPPPSARFGVG